MLTLTRKFTTSLLVDVNADGFPDLVLGTDYYNGNADNIVLLNDGSGDFTKRPKLSFPAVYLVPIKARRISSPTT